MINAMKVASAILIAESQAIRVRDDPNWNSFDGYLTNHYKDEFKSPYPVGYAVSDFGQDDDIKTTFNSLSDSETKLGHHWNYVKDTSKPPPKNYPVPNFGQDTDIKDNFADLKAAEAQLGRKWDWKLLPAKHFELDKGVPGFQA